ncbi:MAG: chorismate mutase [Oscillospiraceae bacterium]|nr:chorismate mutase [Oscillospiraceae bacterium]
MNLENIRKDIDALDNQIAELINKRMKIVENVAEYKKQTGTGITDNKRENEIFARVCTGENEKELRMIFETILQASREYQSRVISSSV